MSTEQYLELERLAETKHEYIDGEMVAMAGGSPAHALIIMNIGGELRDLLKNSACNVFSSDLRVCVRRDRLITYPDVTVACPPLEFLDERRDTITNPRLVVEVLSPSTSQYDRGVKVPLFRMTPSIEEYLLIETAPVGIEHGRRLQAGHWDVRLISDMAAVLSLESIGCEIPVAEIYAGVDQLG